MSAVHPSMKKDLKFEIYNSRSPDKKVRVKSNYINRLEFDHIDNLISQSEFREIVIPDFGFNFVNHYLN